MAKKNQPTAPAAAQIDDEPIVKADGEAPGGGEGDDEDEDEDGDEPDGSVQMKSDVAMADLLKSCDALDALARAARTGVSPRQAALAAKLSKGEALSKSENEELRGFLAGGDNTRTSAKESMMSDENITKGFEVSEWLDAVTTKLCKSIDGVAVDMQKSFAEMGEFHAALATSLVTLSKAVKAQDDIIKSLTAKVEALGGGTPAPAAREPAPAKGTQRSVVGTRVQDGGEVRKSASGGQPPKKDLTRGQILKSIEQIVEKNQGRPVDGIDMVFEGSRYESTGQLSKAAGILIAQHNGMTAADLGLTD